MAKKGASKKGKSASGSKAKVHKGKKGATKRVTKHQKSKGSKRSNSTSSSSSKKKGHGKGLAGKKGKKPSGYQIHMKTAVKKIKQDHPGLGHQEAFKKAAEQWAASPDNPNGGHH